MLLLVFAAGCEDDNPSTQPTPNPPTFAMILMSSKEPSLPTPAEASCAGNVTIRFNLTRDASQVITAATADFQANITGCPSTHHRYHGRAYSPGPAGANGGIVVNTGVSADAPLTNGAGSFTRNGITIYTNVARSGIPRQPGWLLLQHPQLGNRRWRDPRQLVRTN